MGTEVEVNDFPECRACMFMALDIDAFPCCECVSGNGDYDMFIAEEKETTDDGPKSALESQIGGGHYKDMKIQPMEYSMANGLDACQHTAVKYISRFRQKNGVEDLRKAIHCIEMLIEFEEQS